MRDLRQCYAAPDKLPMANWVTPVPNLQSLRTTSQTAKALMAGLCSSAFATGWIRATRRMRMISVAEESSLATDPLGATDAVAKTLQQF